MEHRRHRVHLRSGREVMVKKCVLAAVALLVLQGGAASARRDRGAATARSPAAAQRDDAQVDRPHAAPEDPDRRPPRRRTPSRPGDLPQEVSGGSHAHDRVLRVAARCEGRRLSAMVRSARQGRAVAVPPRAEARAADQRRRQTRELRRYRLQLRRPGDHRPDHRLDAKRDAHAALAARRGRSTASPAT